MSALSTLNSIIFSLSVQGAFSICQFGAGASLTLKKIVIRFYIVAVCVFGWTSPAFALTTCEEYGKFYAGSFFSGPYVCNEPNWTAWNFGPTLGGGNFDSVDASLVAAQAFVAQLQASHPKPCTMTLSGVSLVINYETFQSHQGIWTINGCGGTTPESSEYYIQGSRSPSCNPGGVLALVSDTQNLCISRCVSGFTCTGDRTLTLTPAPNQTPPDPRPKGAEGKDGKSTLELIARVMEGSTPKAGVAVGFKVDADYASGGHAGHSGTRPTGTVPASGVTDANGEFKFKFKASEFAGTETITATCTECSNKTATALVKVKVPDLVELSADPATPARYKLIGSTGKHAANHFFTTDAKEALKSMLSNFAEFNWGVVGVNDASLIWGGRFDIAGAWGGSHHEHRDGQEVDISFYNPGGIPPATRQKMYDELRSSQGIVTPEVLWHLQNNPATGSKAHFHVYLLGQKASRTTPF